MYPFLMTDLVFFTKSEQMCRNAKYTVRFLPSWLTVLETIWKTSKFIQVWGNSVLAQKFSPPEFCMPQ
jgi:hypothetical protein